MRCAQCDCHLDPDDAVMIRGTTICPNCARQGRAIGRTFFGVWLALVIVFFVVPVTVVAVLFLGCCGLGLFSGSGSSGPAPKESMTTDRND